MGFLDLYHSSRLLLLFACLLGSDVSSSRLSRVDQIHFDAFSFLCVPMNKMLKPEMNEEEHGKVLKYNG